MSQRSIATETAMAAFCAFILLVAAPPAKAGLRVSGSAGLGYQVSPHAQVQAGNLMVTAGYEFLGMLRPELGIVGSLEAARQRQPSQAGFELRPMLVIKPPLLPLYGRLTLSGVNLFSPQRRTLAYGASLGVELGLAGLALFGEAGVLPRHVDSTVAWVLEARAGLILSFF